MAAKLMRPPKKAEPHVPQNAISRVVRIEKDASLLEDRQDSIQGAGTWGPCADRRTSQCEQTRMTRSSVPRLWPVSAIATPSAWPTEFPLASGDQEVTIAWSKNKNLAEHSKSERLACNRGLL
jgi:hypothetical protein